ncbi:alpha/beta hydrolase [Helicobacter apodemus]|uniref:Alpha/beta hydrolase n=1 Tax=Helicobacter apodemus TaxID=135569 RepID=A0A2U8FDT4_9HELI|nr:alpha/beta hydrolase [Helicobacter apodemus]AWI34411.1 alpha/beta hydrolase [Helicobacter apodemus]
MQKSILLYGIILTLSLQTFTFAQGGVMQIANPSKEAKANAAKNPFGLVYEGAITKNEKGKVNIKSITYISRGLKIAANLYLPSDFNPKAKIPAIIVAHPNGGVKEQVAGLYAQKLAESSYITLAFDAAYQGASEGKPRNVDTPQNRTEDISAAVDYLLKVQGVDSNRIGILGICGGGGYTLNAAKSDKRLKAVATLSMFNSGLVRREGFLGSEKSSIQERLKNASEARTKEVLEGKISYTSAAPKKLSEEELAKISTDLYREGMVYYGDTHAHPNSTFAYTTSSLLDLMRFDALNQIELINQPLLMLVGDKADTAYMSEAAYKKAGSKDKRLHKLKNTTHIQSYYKKEAVEEALGELKRFYGERL